MVFQVEITEEAAGFILSLPVKMQAKVQRTISLLKEFGYSLPEPHSKKLKNADSLHELRIKVGSDICRLFYFHWKDRIYIITSGYVKKSDKTDIREITKAISIMSGIREQGVKMKKIKTINSDELLKKQMKNAEFEKEYDALDEEFGIAAEIIKRRLAANLTQKQLAELAGTSQPAIARLESGSYENLSLSSLRKIGKALGVKPEIHFKKIKVS